MLEGIGIIGTVHSFAQMANLKRDAKYKIKTGTSLTEQLKELKRATNTSLADRMAKANAAQQAQNDANDQARLAVIRERLRAGKKLTDNEMGFLKRKDEALYNKAVKVQEVREALSRALKKAKTKDEALRAVTEAQARVAAEAVLEAKGGSAPSMSSALGGSSAPAASQSGNFATNAAATPTASEGGEVAVNVQTLPNAPAALPPQDAGTTDAAHAFKATIQAELADRKQSILSGGEIEGKSFADDRKNPAQLAIERTLLARQDRLDKRLANLEAALGQKEQASNPKMPFDEKWLFALAAIQDEWKTFANSRDYEELPRDQLDAEKQARRGKRKKSTKPLYQPAEKRDPLLTGVFAYQAVKIGTQTSSFTAISKPR